MPNTTDEYTLQALFREMQTIKTMQTGNHNTISTKLDSIQNNFDLVKEELNQHSKSLKNLDYEKRRKNLVIFGIPEESDRNQLENVIFKLINENLQIYSFSLLELDFCRRLGKPQQKPRPVLLGLTTQRRKIEILKNSKKFKGTPIHIKEDCPPQDRDTREALLEEMRKLRNEGETSSVKKVHHNSSIDLNGSNASSLMQIGEDAEENFSTHTSTLMQRVGIPNPVPNRNLAQPSIVSYLQSQDDFSTQKN
ncbi:uncharacterized protein LOC113466319 [Diaphorina citri]|uniref:Uncharacterized protein LOC103522680 n=1 Tax=Diaphorina citri TaxID=121845 RepID=A0A1S3DQL2_DIACI|nr:uncharacterized protein LOC103522680 [Diaphorina citri]XP_026676616.1 uncharacterized protein LOC113465885 [Diaphorina citri]XP_026677427.1 uncharacterized protein LOC113466319 [Diaphorina citri]